MAALLAGGTTGGTTGGTVGLVAATISRWQRFALPGSGSPKTAVEQSILPVAVRVANLPSFPKATVRLPSNRQMLAAVIGLVNGQCSPAQVLALKDLPSTTSPVCAEDVAEPARTATKAHALRQLPINRRRIFFDIAMLLERLNICESTQSERLACESQWHFGNPAVVVSRVKTVDRKLCVPAFRAGLLVSIAIVE